LAVTVMSVGIGRGSRVKIRMPDSEGIVPT
jgi:hypothetical protein